MSLWTSQIMPLSPEARRTLEEVAQHLTVISDAIEQYGPREAMKHLDPAGRCICRVFYRKTLEADKLAQEKP